MHWTTDAYVTALGRTTLMVAVSAVAVAVLISVVRLRSIRLQRLAWAAVLLQGCLVAQWPVVIERPITSAPETNDVVRSDVAESAIPSSLPPSALPSGGRETTLAAALPGDQPLLDASPVIAVATPERSTAGIAPSSWRGALLMVWPGGVLLVPVICACRYVAFLRLVRSTTEPGAEWRAEFDQVRAALGVSGNVALRVSDDLGPCLVRRWSGSCIVVPRSLWTALEPQQRRAVLRHELAHYVRGDLWKSLAIRLLSAPQWFNPAAWWAVRRFDECAEWACDELAAGDGASATEYSRLLLSLGTAHAPRAAYLPAARRGSVSTRIRRLLAAPGRDSKAVRCAVPLCAAALLAVNLLRIEVVAQTPSERPVSAAASATPGLPGRMPWHPDDLVAVLGDERGKLWSHAGHVLVTPDGRRLIADAGHSSLFIYDADTLDVLATFGDRPTRLMSAALSQDGSRLIAGYADGTLTLWNISGEQPELEQTVNVMPEGVEQPYLHFVHALRADRVAITAANHLMLWELRGNRLAEVLSSDLEDDLYRPAISPDGRRLVTKITIRPGDPIPPERLIEFDGRKFSLFDCRLQLWDVSDGQLRELSQLTMPLVNRPAFTADGRMIFGVQDVEGRVLATPCVRIVDETLVKQPDLPIRLSSLAVPAFSPDGRLMAVMLESGELQILDVAQDVWEPVTTLKTGRTFFAGIAFSPGGRSIYIPSGSCLERWDRDGDGGYQRVGPRPAHASNVHDISFRSGGDQLMSTGGNTICEWNLRRLDSPKPVIHDAPQIPSGIQRLVAWPVRNGVLFQSSGTRNGIEFWDKSTDAISETFRIDFGESYRDNAWCFALQPGGKLLATGHWDQAIRFWNVEGDAPQKVAELASAHSGHVCNVAFSPDGRILASVGWDHAVKLWDMSTDPPTPGGELGKHDDIVRSVAFSPDGRWLASGDEKGVIRLWDLNSADRPGRTIRHPEDVARVASPYDEQRTMNTLEFSADGRRLLSADGGGRVTVWTVPTGEIVQRWQFPGWIWAARWSPDQQLIATANQNGTVYLLVAPEP